MHLSFSLQCVVTKHGKIFSHCLFAYLKILDAKTLTMVHEHLILHNLNCTYHTSHYLKLISLMIWEPTESHPEECQIEGKCSPWS